MSKKIIKSMDGNEAASYCSYHFTEVAAIYPITPSSNMGEFVDKWAADGLKNMFGMPVKVIEMQSEAGAAGAVHGSLEMGVLTTTYTASQGLLLMIPNMYKMAGTGLPGVIHVAARSIASNALSIFGDHQDVMAVRQTGFGMIASNSVQEVMDLAGIAHLAAIETRVPFVHFFDGFRTSHEVNTIEVLDSNVFSRLIDRDALAKIRELGLSPNRPVTRGTAQSDDVYFQSRIATDQKYQGVDDVVNKYMLEISKETGRNYAPFTYYGAKDATDVIVAMGSVVEASKEIIDLMVSQGQKVGILSVHLYRPFSEKYFKNAMPKTVKRIAVLDRTIESGSTHEPLCLDVMSMYYKEENKPVIIGGIYGLSSKNTTLGMILAVFENLKGEQKDHFTIGITDDVGKTSLAPIELPHALDQTAREVLLFGLGSDGTVGASKNIVKIIGDNTKLFSQSYASYDSKKSGGITRMHLRFSKNPIRSTYLVTEPHFVSCSQESYLNKYDMLKGLREGGIFLLNTKHGKDEIVDVLPNSYKRALATKNAKLFIVNAVEIAEEIGLGNRTNTIMQSGFFKLNENLMTFEEANRHMKEFAHLSYHKYGEEVVEMNYKAIDAGGNALIEVPVKPEWKDLTDDKVVVDDKRPDFVKNLADIVNRIEGDSLPVSAFMPYDDARMEHGSTAYEKRGISNIVPRWNVDTCIQCNQCAFACPHAVIRAFLIDEEEMKKLPAGTHVKKAVGKGNEGLHYAINISPLDCTGCGVCVSVCPTKPEKSLKMVPIEEEIATGKVELAKHFHANVTYKDIGTDSFKNTTFKQPLFEFSGACAGCGETPYIRTITQLFGENMIIANATGCTSIYGGSFPSTPYTKNAEGNGPAWVNSLFEDNAEFGYGMRIANETMRDRIQTVLYNNLDKMPEDLKELANEWLLNRASSEVTRKLQKPLISKLEKINQPYAKELLELKDYFVKVSQWILGGDGWAYDIGYGGIDHVIANYEDVNILVVDTEVYSNTGGQSSKSAQTGAIAKFAASGKKTKKKDLAAIAMSYGHVYVAQINHGASPAQVNRALKEAESYPGPSLIIAYSPCIEHGIKGGLTNSHLQAKLANECGYWPIFRYDPRLEQEGKNPFKIDAPRAPKWDLYREHLLTENRYAQLSAVNPDEAEELLEQNRNDAKRRWAMYKRYEAMDYSINE
ncbi:MAG: pyruvate:ferredoxin (flavodoxin) oxidoreductase [Acholeplasmataceae bacterium]|nr:pyruvate:ferredoxin (flavodoxin) oxidoreductase [Acholeplasmataceae bacterium]